MVETSFPGNGSGQTPTHHHIAGYTAPTVPNNGYVDYISINKKYGDDNFIDITVRSRGTGQMAQITMTREAFALLLFEAGRNI